MKARTIFATLLLAMAGLQTMNAQRVMQVWYNGRYENFPIANVDSVRFVCLVTDIFLSQTEMELTEGETKQLTASVFPVDADERTVLWTSSNPAIASVDGNGLVTAVAAGTSVIAATATDGSGVKAECQVTVVAAGVSGLLCCPDDHHPHVIDLGLPSGTKWCCCNMGANSPEEYGDYFAWGETEPKSEYNWSTYKYCNGSSDTMTKYSTDSNYGYNGFTDGLTELLPEDDAATANWGDGWRIPSNNQLGELYTSNNYTTRTWTTLNGVSGCMITSKSNGNSIFLPATGYLYEAMLIEAGRDGHYWSRSLAPKNKAYGPYFSSNRIDSGYRSRSNGRSVRPVRVQN